MSVWNVPYRRNPFFTGREDVLNRLHEHFARTTTAALTQPPTITGLGGIGKTQVAVEYAHRHKDAYRYIFWVNATSQETLIEGFVALARLVGLAVKDEPDQSIMVEAARQWLAQHDHWLLILDNSDDLTLTDEFLPMVGKGHMLLTTRESATGNMTRFEVEPTSETEGVLFLLRRAKILETPHIALSQVSDAHQKVAVEIVKAMGGLPLALDQVGAYLEETQCGLSSYLNLYEKQRDALLKRRGRSSHEHPEAVATTWSLNFGQVEHLNPSAAELLRFFAFLAPMPFRKN